MVTKICLLGVLFFFQLELFGQCSEYFGKNINCKTKNGKKTGYWIYFIDDNPRLNRIKEGNYLNNRKTGKWTYYSRADDFSGPAFYVYYYRRYFVVDYVINIEVRNDFSSIFVTFGDEYSSYVKFTKCRKSQFYICIVYDGRKKETSKKTIFGLYNVLKENCLWHMPLDSLLSY